MAISRRPRLRFPIVSRLRSQQDPEAQRQKLAKLARLALRRYLRQRLRRSSDEIVDSIARSNAAVFARVAHNIIRGMDGQLQRTSGNDAMGDDLVPGLLCFDEVSVNDPFTALALKGVRTFWQWAGHHCLVVNEL